MHKIRNLFRAKTAQKEFRISNFMLFLCASCYRVFILQQPIELIVDEAKADAAAHIGKGHNADAHGSRHGRLTDLILCDGRGSADHCTYKAKKEYSYLSICCRKSPKFG